MKDNTFWKAILIILIAFIIMLVALLANHNTSYAYNTQDKINFCVEESNNKEFCSEIFRQCKATAKSPNHCVVTAMSVAKAESGFKKSKYGYFGLKSKEKTIKRWLQSYNRYWYTARDGFFFYGDWGQLGKSHYCTDEHSSGSKLGCPNGRLNFHKIWDEYERLFGTL